MNTRWWPSRRSNPSPTARFADLYAEIPDPWLVRFALLLHDIGKGSGRDHVAESLRIAREVLGRLGAPAEDRAAIEFLIEHHLDLSAVMTSRDLHDSATAKMLAARVGTVERLKQLTMLTYADISAVNPEAMTPWRLEQLWQAYLLAYGELTSELYTERIHHAEGVAPARAAFLEGLPVRYLRTHSPEQIDAHFDARPPARIAARGDRDHARTPHLSPDDSDPRSPRIICVRRRRDFAASASAS